MCVSVFFSCFTLPRFLVDSGKYCENRKRKNIRINPNYYVNNVYVMLNRFLNDYLFSSFLDRTVAVCSTFLIVCSVNHFMIGNEFAWSAIWRSTSFGHYDSMLATWLSYIFFISFFNFRSFRWSMPVYNAIRTKKTEKPAKYVVSV